VASSMEAAITVVIQTKSPCFAELARLTKRLPATAETSLLLPSELVHEASAPHESSEL
jgi:hypothetical protein